VQRCERKLICKISQQLLRGILQHRFRVEFNELRAQDFQDAHNQELVSSEATVAYDNTA
jgi:hypothetical protein